MKTPLYISDFGLVNALGCNKQTILEQLVVGSQSGMTERENLLLNDKITVAAVNGQLAKLDSAPLHLKSRNNQLALMAIEQIRDETKEVIQQVGSDRVAIIVGTSTSGIFEGENAMKELQQNEVFPNTYDYRQQEINNLAEFIAHELSISGFSLTISTACSSSAKAFKTAQELIDAGIADAAIVGGVDSICGMTVNGFHALNSTSAGICQPSSLNRDGINIGEAAALAVLRKDKGKVRLLGVGESSDAHHMSAPHPEGHGAIAAMTNALKDANYHASDVDYVNLHGTATPKNDAMEAIAVTNVFGNDVPCSSSKGMVGHTLGAAGATEIGLCWLLLQDKVSYYPPHVWDNVVDPELPKLNLAQVGSKKASPINSCLSNSFAFGGNNVSLLIGLENHSKSEV